MQNSLAAIHEADGVGFDYDDTLVKHDSTYLNALGTHVLFLDHLQRSVEDERFHDFYKDPHTSISQKYIDEVREVSQTSTGDALAFEEAGAAYAGQADRSFSAALKEIPLYREKQSSSSFWVARNKILAAESDPSIGKSEMPGANATIERLKELGKHVVLVTNSRRPAAYPSLAYFFPEGEQTFDQVLFLGGSDIKAKPEPESYTVLSAELPISSFVYCGDNQQDVQYARNIEAHSVTVGGRIIEESNLCITSFEPLLQKL